MSGKRWALKAEHIPVRGNDSFEEAHTFDPTTESAVPHETIRYWKACAERPGRIASWGSHHNPDHFLPKPRPTLREAMADCGFVFAMDNRYGAFDRACRDAGIDPDKRVEG